MNVVTDDRRIMLRPCFHTWLEYRLLQLRTVAAGLAKGICVAGDQARHPRIRQTTSERSRDSIGCTGCFSFNGSKIMPTIGGGCLLVISSESTIANHYAR